MQNNRWTWQNLAVVLVGCFLWAATAGAADNLVGHSGSQTKYRGTTGTQYKITIKANTTGNPATLPLPVNPMLNGGSVSVERGGGVLRDGLTAGTWTALGDPPGSKGWKYKNANAPAGGAVSSLAIGPKAIKLTAKGTGTMPVPHAPNANIQTVIVADGERYCAEAVGPHSKEVDDKSIKTKDQAAPATCPACLVGADSDGDRLDDCYETNTGVYVSPTDTGTDPLSFDSDGDFIGDGDEILGTTGGLDLPALGVNPLHKDLLVEYDWFDDSIDCGAHSHQPTAGAVAMVTAAFAAAPMSNPDGTTGINFIHDYGQGGAFTGGNFISDADGVLSSGVNSAEFVAYKTANFAANRNGYFHYVILPHNYNVNSTSSGQAEFPGDDMIVSLYCAGSDYNVAHTIVHELGHNLGLGHGGNSDCNYKPNYNSVMNYRYQFPGIDGNCDPNGDGVLNYSVGDRIDLDETNLDESMGTCGTPAYDWNMSSSIETGVMLDVNNYADEAVSCGGILTTLRDYDDWGHIVFAGIADGDGAPLVPPRLIDCDNPAPM